MTRSACVKVTWTARYFLASFLINGYFSLLADFSTTRADLHQSSHIQCRNVIITSSYHGDWYKSNNKPWNNDFLSWGLTKCSRHSSSSSGATVQLFPIRQHNRLFLFSLGLNASLQPKSWPNVNTIFRVLSTHPSLTTANFLKDSRYTGRLRFCTQASYMLSIWMIRYKHSPPPLPKWPLLTHKLVAKDYEFALLPHKL